MLGIWKNVQDLETCLSLPELEAILKASHEREKRQQRFAAALKGIDLDEGDKQTAQEAFDRANRKAQAKLRGISEEAFERIEDADMFGLDFETEE